MRGKNKLKLKVLRLVRYQNLSLRKKILLVHILLLIIPFFLLYYYIMGIYISSKEQEALHDIIRVGRISMQNIENYLHNMKELTLQPIFDAGVIYELRQSNTLLSQLDTPGTGGTSYSDYAPRPYDHVYFAHQVRTPVGHLANRILMFNRYIHSVFVIDLNGKYLYTTADNSVVKAFHPMELEWFNATLKKDGQENFIGSYNINQYIDFLDNEGYVFSMARTIKDLRHQVGMILINVDIRYLRDVCLELESIPGERTIILNNAHHVIYDSKSGFGFKPVQPHDFDGNTLTSLNLNEESIKLTDANGDWIVVPLSLGDWDLKMVRIIPEAMLLRDIHSSRNQLTLFLIAFVSFSILITIFISYSITNPLQKLIKTMKAIEKGDLSRRSGFQYKDEIGQLGRSFNRMLRKIEQLIHMVYTTGVRKREAELQALQAQINPHFIYNTMESIRMMAKLNQDPDTSQMAMILGKLLRYSINIKNKIVTVSEEIEHLRNYIAIQNYRFSDRFHLVLDIEQALYEMKVIKLIYQPIIENFICHGLENIEGKGVIRITGYREDPDVIFTIEDNGCGISEDDLEELNQKINDFTIPEENNGGIGLRNINERIKLFYGDTYGITIYSTAGLGTTVKIRIPSDALKSA